MLGMPVMLKVLEFHEMLETLGTECLSFDRMAFDIHRPSSGAGMRAGGHHR